MAISEIPPFLASFMYPVIELSTNKDEPSHIYFLEDALELWLVVVQNSKTLTTELLRLSSNLLPIIGKSKYKFTNHIEFVCTIAHICFFFLHRKFIGIHSDRLQYNSGLYFTRSCRLSSASW